jgi:hypothetical protein
MGVRGFRARTLILQILRYMVDFRGSVSLARSVLQDNLLSNSIQHYPHQSILSILSPIRGGAIIGVFMI